MPIQLIVGLGNPGQEYELTRHNAGAWLVQRLTEQHKIDLRSEPKFKGLLGTISDHGNECKLFLPATYMNNSGLAVKAITSFYKIPVENILVAHDELDFLPGIVRIKQDGGANGHKGLISIIEHLNTAFYRLRIGIGRPENKDELTNYVLGNPSRSDKKQIVTAIDLALSVMPLLLEGNVAAAMQIMHGKEPINN